MLLKFAHFSKVIPARPCPGPHGLCFAFVPRLTPFRYLLQFCRSLSPEHKSTAFITASLFSFCNSRKQNSQERIFYYLKQSSTSCQVPVLGFCTSLAARVDRCRIPHAAVNFYIRGKAEADYGLET